MDNVLLVVDDLKAAIAFFTELGLELEGETTVEGQWVDRVVGIDGVRSDIAMMRTRTARGGSSWTSSTRPRRSGLSQRTHR
jgi:catechol 2,3-dioxygenase-like lactoylglutathione lyase family enzyme